MNDHNAMDALCRRMLSAASGHHSRRAFLSRVSRGLFGLVGVAIAASAPLFTAGCGSEPTTEEEAKRDKWKGCGLHGYLCAGNCDPNANGNSGALGNPSSPVYAWYACCKDDQGQWHCCTYADFCGTQGTNWGQNCPGNAPSGPSWCGGGSGTYICTAVSCAAAGSSQAACQANCGSPVC